MINRILIFLLILFILTSCANLPTSTGDSLTKDVEHSFESGSNSITVEITLLQPLAAGESLLLAKLDVVSGAWIDPKFYSIDRLDETHFKSELPIEDQALIRYKYIKVGAEQVEEINSVGDPFGYRTIDPMSGGSISDVICGWQDGSIVPPNGRMVGTIRSSLGDTPLGGILVEVQGRTAITDIFGRYELSSLPEGEFFVRFQGIHQGYSDFQQLTVIKAGSVTVADVWLQQQTFTRVNFELTVDSDVHTDSTIYLVSDGPMLGNSSWGKNETYQFSVIRMEKRSDTRYQASTDLPVGYTIKYKYTLGDGFWGSERDADKALMVRSLTIPTEQTAISDSITSWGGEPRRINVHLPADTPATLPLMIQFNAFEWSQPIPLTEDGSGGFFIEIAQPLVEVSSAQGKVCAGNYGRTNCGIIAGAGTAAVSFVPGDPIELTVDSWEMEFGTTQSSDLMLQDPLSVDPEAGYSLRNFSTGHEFLAATETENITSGDGTVMIVELSAELSDDGIRFIPEYSGLGTGDPNLVRGLTALREKGLSPWLFLNITAARSTVDATFSGSDPDQFGRFTQQLNDQLINLVQVANLSGVNTIVIGGDGVNAMTPGAFPIADVTTAWQTTITNIREHFDGRIYFSAEYNNYGLSGLPGFDLDVDGYLIDWSTGIAVTEDQTVEELASNIQLMLDYDIIPAIPFGKRIILRANVPSTTGVLFGCANNDTENCVMIDGGAGVVDKTGQALVYQAFLTALSERDDIEGFVSGGYDPLSISIENTASVYGKPAYADVENWIETVYTP